MDKPIDGQMGRWIDGKKEAKKERWMERWMEWIDG